MYLFKPNKDLLSKMKSSSIFIFLIIINLCSPYNCTDLGEDSLNNFNASDNNSDNNHNNISHYYANQLGSIEGIFGKVAKTVVYGGATFARINNRLLCPLLKRETDKDNQDQPILYVFNNFLERQRAFRIYADDEITPWMINVAQFDPNQMTFIFVHGWLGGIHNELWLNQAKNTILKVSETFDQYGRRNKLFRQSQSNVQKQNQNQSKRFNLPQTSTASDSTRNEQRLTNTMEGDRKQQHLNTNKINREYYFFNSTSYDTDSNDDWSGRKLEKGLIFNSNNINIYPDDNDAFEGEDSNDEIKVQEEFKPNVIIVEWSDFARGSLYSATQNSFKVSKRLADLLIQLAEVGNLKPELMHCLGHSIGTHICGQAARYAFPPKQVSPLFKSKTLSSLTRGEFDQLKYRRMGRITALDPGGFCYEIGVQNETTYLGLKPSDALVVDAYYSNRTPFGNKFLVGQYNVRLNNGFFQKPCSVWLNQTTSIEYFKAAVRFTMGSIGNNDILTCDHYFSTKFAGLIPYINNNKNYNNNIIKNNNIKQLQEQNAACSYVAYACDSYRNFLRGRCGLCKTRAQCYVMDFQYQKEYGYATRKNALEHIRKYSSYFNDLNYNNQNNDFDNYDLEDGDPSLPLGGVKYVNRKVHYMLITSEEPFCATTYRVRVNLDTNLVDIGSFRKSWLEIRFYRESGDLLYIKDSYSGKVGETIPLFGPWIMNPEERLFTGVEPYTLTGMFSFIDISTKDFRYLNEVRNVVVTYNNRLSRRQDPFSNPIESIQIDYLSSSNEKIRAKNSRLLLSDEFKIIYKHLEQTAEMVDLEETGQKEDHHSN